jgi:hypothetical protein
MKVHSYMKGEMEKLNQHAVWFHKKKKKKIKKVNRKNLLNSNCSSICLMLV